MNDEVKSRADLKLELEVHTLIISFLKLLLLSDSVRVTESEELKLLLKV